MMFDKWNTRQYTVCNGNVFICSSRGVYEAADVNNVKSLYRATVPMLLLLICISKISKAALINIILKNKEYIKGYKP